MKNLVFRLFLASVVAVASMSAYSGGDIKNGEALANAECAACHAADGNSPMSMFPKLAGLGEKYLLKQMHDIRNVGENSDPKKTSREIGEMAGLLDSKTAQELADIAAFYASKNMQLSGAKEITVQINSGERVDGMKLGSQIYMAGNLETGVPACSGCHSPRGLGNSPAGFPRLSGQHADYIEKQLNAFRVGDRTNDGETMVMREVAARMTDAEIKAVANFIAGLN